VVVERKFVLLPTPKILFFLRCIICEQTCIYHCGSAVSSIRSQLPVDVLMRPSSQFFSLDASELKRLSFISTVCPPPHSLDVCPSSVQSVLQPTVWPSSRWFADFLFHYRCFPSVAPPFSAAVALPAAVAVLLPPLLYLSPYCSLHLPKRPTVYSICCWGVYFFFQGRFSIRATCRPAVALLRPPNPCDHLQKSRCHSLKFFSELANTFLSGN
jgi:hypothetical protein